MHTIEIFRDLPFTSIDVIVNGISISSGENTDNLQLTITDEQATIEIAYQPRNTLPKIRINNFLINTWLAGAVDTDRGMLLNIDDSFADRYKAKDISGAIASLPEKESSAPEMFDKFIGINNLYPELVAEIRATLKI
jgi:hypothetical protein